MSGVALFPMDMNAAWKSPAVCLRLAPENEDLYVRGKRIADGVFLQMLALAKQNCADSGRRDLLPRDLSTALQVMSLPSFNLETQLDKFENQSAERAARVSVDRCFTEVQFGPDGVAIATETSDGEGGEGGEGGAPPVQCTDDDLDRLERPAKFTRVPKAKWDTDARFQLGNAHIMFRTAPAPTGSLGKYVRELATAVGEVLLDPCPATDQTEDDNEKDGEGEEKPEATSTTTGADGAGGAEGGASGDKVKAE